MWIGIFFGLVLMAVFGGAFLRSRLAIAVGAGVALLAVIVIFGGSATNSKLVEPVLERGATILNPGKTTQEASLQERARETSVAWKAVKEHPVVGVGAGASYGMLITQSVGSPSLIVGYVQIPQLFLHNQYLYLVLISGVPGLIAFLVFLLDPVLAAVRRVPRDPAITACGVGVALVMVSAVVAIYFTAENFTLPLGLLTGVIIADRETRVPDRSDSGLLS
jgi:O-antigen ligase